MGPFCLWPRCGPDCHTFRAPWPWYQPSRYAVTWYPVEVDETNSGNGSPCRTLTLPAYPSISCSAPRWRITQCGSPGRAFSAIGAVGRGDRLAVVPAVLLPVVGLEQAAAAAPTAPATAAPRNARRPSLPSPLMRIRMPQPGRPRDNPRVSGRR